MGPAQHLLFLVFGFIGFVVPWSGGETTVERLEGDPATLPCSGGRLDQDLYWYRYNIDPTIADMKIVARFSPKGVPSAPFYFNSPWKDFISIVNAADLKIRTLSAARDNGRFYCQVTSAGADKYMYVTVVVLDPPDVSVTYNSTTRILTCTAYGVPDSYTFSPWEQRTSGQLIQKLSESTSGPASQTLILSSSLTFEDTGHYTCTVSNGVGQKQRNQILIKPEAAPEFDVTLQSSITIQTGKTEVLSVGFYTQPKYSKVEWLMYENNRILPNHREKPSSVILSVHNTTANFEGFQSILKLEDVVPDDEGNYTIRVANVVNGVTQTTEIVVFVNIAGVQAEKSVIDKQEGAECVDDRILVPTLGAVIGVFGLVIIAGGIIGYRRRRRNTGDTINENGQRSPNADKSEAEYETTDLRANNPTAAGSVPAQVYEALPRAAPDAVCENALPDRPYEQLQLHSRKENLAENRPSSSMSPVYQNCSGTTLGSCQNVPVNTKEDDQNTRESSEDIAYAYYNL